MTARKKGFTSRDRLLKLIEIMQKFSDEQNRLSLREIVDHYPLEVEVNLATIKLDLDALANSDLFKTFTYQEKDGLEKRYWYEGAQLKLHELRLLTDAVVAAKFIPQKETVRLLNQLNQFSANRITDEMSHQVHIADEQGVALSEVGNSVHILHEAVYASKVIEFQYGKFTIEKKFALNREGSFYKIQPYGLVWSQD